MKHSIETGTTKHIREQMKEDPLKAFRKGGAFIPALILGLVVNMATLLLTAFWLCLQTLLRFDGSEDED